MQTIERPAVRRNRDVGDLLAQRREVRNHSNTFGGTAHWTDSGHAWGSWLPEKWADEFNARRHDIVYVAYSFNTPMAWIYSDGQRVMPNVSYSQRTSVHQGHIRGSLFRNVPHGVERYTPGDTFNLTGMPKRKRTGRIVLATNVLGNSWYGVESVFRDEWSRFEWTVHQ